MKSKLNSVWMIILFLGLAPTNTVAQQDDEAVVRRLDNLEREAVLRGDTVALFNQFWSSQMVVNTPTNRVGTVEGTKMNVRTGKLDYASFERTVEKITLIENIAIVMGQEVLIPKGKSDNVGKTVTRRFTNIWMKGKNGWHMVARQATIISVM